MSKENNKQMNTNYKINFYMVAILYVTQPADSFDFVTFDDGSLNALASQKDFFCTPGLCNAK